jgi:hypothetical protein
VELKNILATSAALSCTYHYPSLALAMDANQQIMYYLDLTQFVDVTYSSQISGYHAER